MLGFINKGISNESSTLWTSGFLGVAFISTDLITEAEISVLKLPNGKCVL